MIISFSLSVCPVKKIQHAHTLRLSIPQSVRQSACVIIVLIILRLLALLVWLHFCTCLKHCINFRPAIDSVVI
jgi:hypothetical protein